MARLNRTLIADIDVFQGLEDADLDTVLEHVGERPCAHLALRHDRVLLRGRRRLL